MCGIIGIVGERMDESSLRHAVDILSHRGPDDRGYHLDPTEPVALGHARLAVVGLHNGRQPLHGPDSESVLVCNGEIYGFEEIRADLARGGYCFRTESDSEVILGLYHEHGLDFLAHLRGEYAFLLLDRRRHRLLAVRDRFGIKPLFFSRTAKGYVFASEAKGIFATGLVAPVLHPVAVRDMRGEAWVDSMFAAIEAVPPGCYVQVDTRNGESKTCRYWDLSLESSDSGGNEKPWEHYCRRLGDLLDEAVALRIRADVPVGVALSGGLDSSAVAGILRSHVAGELHSFCIAFPNHAELNEADIARRTAAFLGTSHHEVIADDESLLGALETSIWHSELATKTLNGAGKFLLAKSASRYVKVLLTGEGSDEVFFGYDYFRPRSWRTRLLRCLLSADPADVHPLARPGLKVVRWLQRQVYRQRHHALLRSSPCGGMSIHRRERRLQTPGGNRLLRAQYFSLRGRMLSYILTISGDRPEMAHGLEARQPMLDHKLFEFARTIPLRWKAPGVMDKQVMREAVRPWVTDEIHGRPKFGYRAPTPSFVPGFSQTLDELMGRHLSTPAIRAAGIYRPLWIHLMRWTRSRLPLPSGLAWMIDQFLFYAMTVHILHAQFCSDGDRGAAIEH